MKKKIIIAQSIQDAVDKGNTLFARGGIAVFSARSCEEILDLHRTHKADLIIADLGMPDMGGEALCSVIRKNADLKDVSIVMACEQTPSRSDECRRAGANAVLPKPLDPIVLFSTVSQMLMVHQRMSARMPLRITVQGTDEKTAFVGISNDISVSGMLLESGRKLQEGDQLQCSFTIGPRPVSVSCIVTRVHKTQGSGFLYGVKYKGLDAKNFVLIEQFVKGNIKA